jgi:hypothetical protein
MPNVSRNITKEAFRDIIKYERRIELAFEDHRLWDLRRWMEAETALNKPLQGLETNVLTAVPVLTENVDEEGNVTQVPAPDAYGTPRYERTFEYKPIDVEPRTFKPYMYLYPIPQKELSIAQNWVQNPGW